MIGESEAFGWTEDMGHGRDGLDIGDRERPDGRHLPRDHSIAATLRKAYPVAPADAQFRADVVAGLDRRPQRSIPARWFYDRHGSELFEAITRLVDYLPARAERALLERHGDEIRQAVGPDRAVIEFGSGSSAKTPVLLRHVEPAAYVPIDISGQYLNESAAVLASLFPELPVLPLEADFTGPLELPTLVRSMKKLGFFPGSTIGNMTASGAVDLLRTMHAMLGPGAMLVVGIDRPKDERALIRAYDDPQGVTAAFNLNLLHRINRELGGDIPVDAFRHVARWNVPESRIEMHLQASRAVSFVIDDRRFTMAANETIHTENSHKYTSDTASLLLRAGAWTPVCEWIDPRAQFGLILAEARPAAAAP